MSKKSPWWRKPFKKDDEKSDSYDDDLDHYEDENDEKHFRSRRPKDRVYGSRPNDWYSEYPRRRIRAFDDDFDSIFSRSSFGFRDDIFSDMEREFSEMHKRMDKLFRQAAEGKLQPGEGGPFVYGFSMRTGPDGIPHVQEFGNMPPELRSRFRESKALPFTAEGELGESCNTCGPAPGTGKYSPTRERRGVSGEFSNTRKPLTDVLDCDNHVSITVELPGIEKKDINLEIIDNELELDVESPTRKYYDKIPLPAEVDPNSISASFKNGVLEVCVKRLKPKKKKGKKIDIQ